MVEDGKRAAPSRAAIYSLKPSVVLKACAWTMRERWRGRRGSCLGRRISGWGGSLARLATWEEMPWAKEI
jgi:hypothetical protein